MRCINCGFANGWDDRFCSKCGAALPGPEGAESEQAIHNPPTATAVAVKPKQILKILVISISILALAVIAVLLVVLLGDKPSAGSDMASSDVSANDASASGTAAGDAQFGHALIKLYSQNESETVFLTFEGAEIEGAEFEDIYRYSYSFDRSACAVVTGEETDEMRNESGKLFIITAEGATEISEDVLSCIISDDGSHIAYVADVKEYIGNLYLYDVSAQSSVKLASGVMADENYICISPDGKSVGYIGDYEFSMDADVNVSYDQYTGHVCVDGETTELGDRCYPVALSNKADFVYYFEETDLDTAFYVKYGDTQEKLSSDEITTHLFFNQALSELLFIGDKARLWSTDSGLLDISDDYTAVLSSRYSISKRASVNLISMFTLSLSTFKNEMIWTSDGTVGIIYAIGPEYDMIKIAEGNNPYVSGNTIVYTDVYGNCYGMENIKKDTGARIIFKNASSLYAASSLADIYCLGSGELYYVTLSGETTVIAGGVSAVALSPYDTLYYLTSDGELFSVDGDAASVKIAEQVSDLDSYSNGVYYTADTAEGLDVYVNTTGNTFVRILSGINSIERVTVFGFDYMK